MVESQSDLTFEDVARLPLPGTNCPVNLAFSPDGKYLAYLESPNSAELTRYLYCMEMATRRVVKINTDETQGNTETNLSLEEKLRRERLREHGSGITSYMWSPSVPATGLHQILIPLQGNLFVVNGIEAQLTLLFDKTSTGAKGGAIDPQYSPDGKWVGFVQENEVYIVSSATVSGRSNKAIQITSGARENGKSNGLACFLTQEELSRFRGFWWSPDSLRIAFEEIDDSGIPEFRIMHSGKKSTSAEAQEDHRYPFAGGPNPKRRLGVIPIRSDDSIQFGQPVWMDFGCSMDEHYIARVQWLQNGFLSAQKLNRLQDKIELVLFDVINPRRSIVIEEQNKVWINVNYLFRPLNSTKNGKFRFIWGSERTGFMHLYLYEMDGSGSATLVGSLTSGEWVVESIDGLTHHGADEILFITGTFDSSTERHLYAISLETYAGKPVHPPKRITESEGMHSVVMDHEGKYFVDVYGSISQPMKATLHNLGGLNSIMKAESSKLWASVRQNATIVGESKDARLARLRTKLQDPHLISFPSDDGSVNLYGAVYLPDSSVFGSGPHPTLVCVYGGPHVQRVANSWYLTADMRAQHFRAQGFVVLKVDNRGSFRRGLGFEAPIKHKMGTIEIVDQVAGVKHLVEKGFTIPNRVGIYGWSYGGYLSAMSLMKAPEYFKLAVAGAPVTSWDGYDSCYTERYMSTPQLNPTGYEEGSVLQYVKHMKKEQKLLLVHGLIDENVHFRHTARLINALILARKNYDVLLFPDERHSPRNLEDRIYMEERIFEYVKVNL